MSERRACRALGQHRSTQRKVPQGRADEERLTDSIIELADKYGRFGYRMVTGRAEGPTKAKKEGAALAQRRVMQSAQAGAAQPCLVL